MADVRGAFAEALIQRDIISPDPLIADGRMHRCDAAGKNGKGDAAYLLHLDNFPAGGFENHRDGLGWSNWKAPTDRQFTAAEKAAHRSRLESIKREREADDQKRREEAAEVAKLIWRDAKPAPADHPYLVRKGIQAHGLRQHEGRLVIPLRDGAALCSLQFIDSSGDKRFLPNGRTRGCYFAIGQQAATLCVAEGYATAAAIHETTGHAVAVAFNANNIEPVAVALRAKFPEARLIICADDDHASEGNPGRSRATAAAKAVEGFVAVPDFGAERPDSATDFNDLLKHGGAQAVSDCIERARTVESPTAAKLDDVLIRRMADIEPQPIQWLWPGRIARGKATLIAGHPGLGKSQLSASLAAIVTTGGRWPVDRSQCPRGSVLLLNAEDDAADTIRPRLDAAGADVTRVHILDAVRETDSTGRASVRPFSLAADLERLDRTLGELGDVALVVIDPISAYLGGTDSHKNADVRALLAPLGEIAARHAAAFLLVSHLNKGAGLGEAMMRVTGSLAFVAAARAAYLVAKDPDDEARRLFLPMKNNAGPDREGLAFRVETVTLPGGIEAPRLGWESEPVTMTADQAMRTELPEHRSATDEAMDFLKEALANGPVIAKDLKRQASDAGIEDKPLRRAREKLGIKVERQGFGPDMKSFWMLPVVPNFPVVPIHAHWSQLGTNEEKGTNGEMRGEAF